MIESNNNFSSVSSSLTLLTDLYQLTMAYGYWKAGLANKEAVFHMCFRKPPFKGGFTIAAGLENVINYLENFKFDESDLSYLSTLKGEDNSELFSQEFLNYLSNLTFSCNVDAVPEGTAVFPYEPLIRVKGPIIQCQLLESIILNLINFPSLIATKAARMCIASKGDPVLEFGLRRAQGVNGALTASRAAYIGGCSSTSNLLAGKLYGIPVSGTHSHSWVMVFDNEKEAFQTYAENLPNNCVFLVDTYDTLEGIKHAIEVGEWLRNNGKKLLGIRLDSGDLTYLSIKCREMLNGAGFNDTKIIATNQLDEIIISELKRQGAQINVWGVGTNLVTAVDQPALDGVYKLSAIRDPGKNWEYKLKLSEQILKISNPGIPQVRRFFSSNGYIADAIYDMNSQLDNDWTIVDPLDPTKRKIIKKDVQCVDLLKPIYREGKIVYKLPSLHEIREKTQQELKSFDMGIKRFLNPHLYVVGLEKSLYDLKTHLILSIRNQTSYAYIPTE